MNMIATRKARKLERPPAWATPTPAATPGPAAARRTTRELETVAIARPRCPRCRGWDLLKYRSLRDQGDGTAMWWVRCRAAACHHRFKVVLE
jgi:hypothetical protein